MTRIAFLDLTLAYDELRSAIEHAMSRVASSGQYLFGRETEAFESEFADYIGTRYCVAVGNGLDALSIALRALEIGTGDEVLVPSNTFIATWMAVTAVGARPVPVEPDPITQDVSPAGFVSAATARTRCIIPVHLYGRPCKMREISDWAVSNSISVVEDAAQSHGALLEDGTTRTGSIGDAGGWSFYPGKNLGAFGDAGAVTTSRQDLAEACRQIRNYGSLQKYHHGRLGLNSRMSEMDAAILRIKLRVLDEWNRRRHNIAQQYGELLSDLPMILPQFPPYGDSSWHLYVIQTDGRDELQQYLKRRGVETQIHYPIPPHRQPIYAQQYPGDGCPTADRLSRTVLSLPIGPHMTESQVRVISDCIHQYFDKVGERDNGSSAL